MSSLDASPSQSAQETLSHVMEGHEPWRCGRQGTVSDMELPFPATFTAFPRRRHWECYLQATDQSLSTIRYMEEGKGDLEPPLDQYCPIKNQHWGIWVAWLVEHQPLLR